MQRVEEKNADLYAWLGDGGGRDYSSFEGNKVYLYKPETEEKQLVGSVKFWKKMHWKLLNITSLCAMSGMLMH